MKKIVKTTYACGICGYESEKPEGALECEKQGVAIPEFKQFEVVELVGVKPGELIRTVSGHQIPFQLGTKAVIRDNAKEEWPDPHLLPEAYDVWVSTVSQENKYKRELISGVGREHLKRTTTRNGAICPLCGASASPVQNGFYEYLGFGSGLPNLKNISVQKCQNCNVEFFTGAQSLKVKAMIRNRIKWPIADTKKLIREFQFD